MAQDNPLVAILQLLAENQKVQADYLRQKKDGNREQRFKIHRNIPKITAEGATSLLDEFDDFETAFTRTNPPESKDWAMTLDDALEGTAKAWRDYIILTEPGKTIYAATLMPNATNTDYITYYRYVRGELFSRAGLWTTRTLARRLRSDGRTSGFPRRSSIRRTWTSSSR